MIRNFKYRALLLLVAGALLGGVYVSANAGQDERTQGTSPAPVPSMLPMDDITIRKADGEEFHFTVELALTQAEQAQGLMNRTSMADNAGMLFLFGGEGKRAFWMKDTLIPLDMLFIHRDGEIHHIHTNARPQDETMITSEEDSSAVLELHGGTADRLGLKKGDKVIYKVFRNVENQ